MHPLLSPALGIYVFVILAVNIGFSYVPLIDTPLGTFSPMAIIVGIVFVARDFAQRNCGHWVWVGMILGTVFSYIFADPYVATASAAAFFISEAVDWGIYTVTKKPFGERVLISSAIATPVDTGVFLFGISHFSPGTFVLMVLSKMVASFVIWYMGKRGSFASAGYAEPETGIMGPR